MSDYVISRTQKNRARAWLGNSSHNESEWLFEPLRARKTIPLPRLPSDADAQLNVTKIVEAKFSRVKGVAPPKYSAFLVRLFGAGILLFVLGVAAFIASVFIDIATLNYTAAVLLALGSFTVALTLFRGQDINERFL
jgi:hypothetical protein